MQKKLLLIDGNSIFHRAYHALPPFKTTQGEPINAVYGFTSMLFNILNSIKPDFIAVAFDVKGKTFRHHEYEEYKATRKKAPDDLYIQMPRSKEVLASLNIPIYEMEGFEGDDVLATLALQGEKMANLDILILTSDRDALQLVTEKTSMIAPVKGITNTFIYTPKAVMEKYGIRPDQIPDLKGLQGDSSDNIKGVEGVGAKTAQKLLNEYETIENIYKHIDELKGKLKERMIAGEQDAIFSKKLATLHYEVPVSLDLKHSQVFDYDFEKILSILELLEFKSLTKKANTFNIVYSKKRLEEKIVQKTLF